MFVIKKNPTNVGNVFDLYSIFYGIVMFLALVLASLFNFLQFFSDFSSFSDFCLLSHGPPAPICPLIHLFSVAHWGLGSSPKPAPPALLDGHQSISYPAGRLNPSSGGHLTSTTAQSTKQQNPMAPPVGGGPPRERMWLIQAEPDWVPLVPQHHVLQWRAWLPPQKRQQSGRKDWKTCQWVGKPKGCPTSLPERQQRARKRRKGENKPKHELYLEEMVQ